MREQTKRLSIAAACLLAIPMGIRAEGKLDRTPLVGDLAVVSETKACEGWGAKREDTNCIQGRELERHEYRRQVMGSEARLVFYAENQDEADRVAALAFQEMDRLDAMLSDWRADSELALLSLHAGGPPVPASPALLEVLSYAKQVAEVTTGAFDPTLGRLTKLWRACREKGVLPSPAELIEARAKTGFESLTIDREAGTVQLAIPEMELDLGGIAKGYACDRALACLFENGVRRALVEAGGDFAAGDPPPGTEGWRLQSACVEKGGESAPIFLSNRGLASSGDTYQFIDVEGQRYSHLIDPRTGLGATQTRCVTVLGPNGALADALASAASLPNFPEVSRALAQFDAHVVQAVDCEAIEHDQSASVPHQATATGAARANQTGQTPDQGDMGAWVPLFDGNTLRGWTTKGGRYDGEAEWSVEDNSLVGRTGPGNAGGLIYTDRMYSSFELAMFVWIDYPFDSGVFTNMLPTESGLKGLQVTLDYRPDGEVGGIYADGWLQHQPDGKAKWKRGEWNHVRVRQTGFDKHIRFWLNDELVTEFRLPSDASGFAPHGRIGLQVHGGGSEGSGNMVKFRGMRIRELPLFDDLTLDRSGGSILKLDAASRQAGWHNLLAGDSLEAFDKSGKDVYTLKSGTLSMPANADGGVLATKADFQDFRMRLDFAVPTMGNSGVYLRSARDGTNPSYSGAEVQILDDRNWETVTGTTLKPWQFTGSLYGSVPAGDHGHLAANGTFNRYEILVRGDRIAVGLNGYVLYDVHTSELTPAQGPPFSERAPMGFVGVQTHGPAQAHADEVLSFRNWFIQEL